jgi:TRAP-type C4-dicarboxylate transport system permease large subunit
MLHGQPIHDPFDRTLRISLIAGLEIDPIWFGILLVTVVKLGLIMPPS